MSRSYNYKPQRQPSTLMDSFGAVQAALAAMPEESVKTPRNAADAFLMTDATLASIDKQRHDAESQYKKLVTLYGFNDPMVEAMQIQRAAIENAYNTRLSALRRKREEQQGRGALTASNDDAFKQGNTRKTAEQHSLRIKREEERLLQIRMDEQQKQKRRNDTLWLWAFLMLGLFDTKHYQQRTALRPV